MIGADPWARDAFWNAVLNPRVNPRHFWNLAAGGGVTYVISRMYFWVSNPPTEHSAMGEEDEFGSIEFLQYKLSFVWQVEGVSQVEVAVECRGQTKSRRHNVPQQP